MGRGLNKSNFSNTYSACVDENKGYLKINIKFSAFETKIGLLYSHILPTAFLFIQFHNQPFTLSFFFFEKIAETTLQVKETINATVYAKC